VAHAQVQDRASQTAAVGADSTRQDPHARPPRTEASSCHHCCCACCACCACFASTSGGVTSSGSMGAAGGASAAGTGCECASSVATSVVATAASCCGMARSGCASAATIAATSSTDTALLHAGCACAPPGTRSLWAVAAIAVATRSVADLLTERHGRSAVWGGGRCWGTVRHTDIPHGLLRHCRIAAVTHGLVIWEVS
jgi:hypothetical protein